MTWFEGRMVGFDLETTGTDPEEARIVTAAIAECGGGFPTQAETWLADPGVEIPDEAAEVHGITTEKAQAEGEAAVEVVRKVIARLQFPRQVGRPLVIFNARYDLTVLDREARRLGLDPLPMDGLYVVDPLVIDKHLDRYRKGSRKLDAICAHYGATLDQAHAADSDAVAACRGAWVVGAKGRIVRKAWNAGMERERAELTAEWEAVRYDLRLLHEAQVRWAHDQAVGLAEYFREQGPDAKGDADGVRTEWPLVPAGEAVLGG